MELEIPAVYVDRNNRTTIALHVGRKYIAHIPMGKKMSVVKTPFLSFVRQYPVWLDEYAPARAAARFLESSKYLGITHQAKRLLMQLVRENPITENDLQMQAEDTNVAKKVVPVAEVEGSEAPQAKSEVEAEAAEKAKPGRVAKYPDYMKITLLVEDNPKRGLSRDRYALYRTGMTVGEYIAAGGKRVDIDFDVKRNFISVSN